MLSGRTTISAALLIAVGDVDSAFCVVSNMSSTAIAAGDVDVDDTDETCSAEILVLAAIVLLVLVAGSENKATLENVNAVGLSVRSMPSRKGCRCRWRHSILSRSQRRR